jgi:hypothetical protein
MTTQGTAADCRPGRRNDSRARPPCGELTLINILFELKCDDQNGSKFMKAGIIKRNGVAIAAFVIVAAATVALELYAGHQLEYSGFML